MRATMTRFGWVPCLALAIAAAACGGGGGASGGGPVTNPATRALTEFEDCDDLRDAIVADARERIALQAEQLRENGFFFASNPEATPLGSEATPPMAAPTSSPAAGAGETPRDSTDTNVQVRGVDEADVVEIDGTRLYLLHGSELVILDTIPPEATAVRERIAIEGTPLGMFVADGRALVASSVIGETALGGLDRCHVLGAPFPAFDGHVHDVPCGTLFTKVTLIDLTGDTPRVARETYLEGSYLSARRHGGVARVVVSRSWGLPPSVPEAWSFIYSGVPPMTREEYRDRVDAWESEAGATVDATTLAEWLPARRDREQGTIVDHAPRCEDVHVPPPLLTGESTTRIFAFDMRDDAGAARDTVIMGGASSIFASGDTLILAQPDWSWWQRQERTDRTALHVFALPAESLETTYLTSAFVPGVPLSQFAFDAQDDVISIATTITPGLSVIDAPVMASRIVTMRLDGNALIPIGTTGDLAPGERIFAVRFVGTRAYLVTFRQIDPLFVIDLADPAHPQVLGSVELPGFSEYLHPLDDGHLLTIGVDDGVRGGVALRIFDVSDPTAPRLTHIHALPGIGSSPAQFNHLAFTFDVQRGLLALPYNRYDPDYRSSLFLIAVDATSGFTVRGEIDHESVVTDICEQVQPCFAFVSMERGVFIDDWLYSISSAAVGVNAVADLAPVKIVELPQVAPTPLPLPLPIPMPQPS